MHQGGGVAAPIASQILGEVLPYLEVSKDNEEDEEEVKKAIVPKIEGMKVSEAKAVLKDLNLNMEFSEDVIDQSDDKIIQEQIPAEGAQVFEGCTLIVK